MLIADDARTDAPRSIPRADLDSTKARDRPPPIMFARASAWSTKRRQFQDASKAIKTGPR
jgi:hypothetical protein